MNPTQRNTRQRQVILEELQKVTSHPTAASLYQIVRRKVPKISLGTVYRNLELLARSGAIQKLEFAGGEARFDGNVAGHDHLRCVRCGRVDDVSAPALDLSGGEAKDWCGYQVLGHRLEFFGICPQCQAKQDETDGRPKMPLTQPGSPPLEKKCPTQTIQTVVRKKCPTKNPTVSQKPR